MLDGVTGDGEIREAARDGVLEELRRHFRPEFLNRVDDVVLFKPLTLQELEKIVDLQIADLRSRLAEMAVTLELTDEARAFIARAGFDPVYGARPLKRYLQHELETRVGRALVSGEITPGTALSVGVEDGDLCVDIRAEATAAKTS